MSVRNLTIAMAILCSVVPAQARFVHLSSIRGGTLVELCGNSKSGQAEVLLDSCAAYILGAADALSTTGKFCNSGDAWTLQAVAVTKRYIRDNPQKWGQHASTLVQDALSQAFPCIKKKLN
jgi:Rap1a immunity proteins